MDNTSRIFAFLLKCRAQTILFKIYDGIVLNGVGLYCLFPHFYSDKAFVIKFTYDKFLFRAWQMGVQN